MTLDVASDEAGVCSEEGTYAAYNWWAQPLTAGSPFKCCQCAMIENPWRASLHMCGQCTSRVRARSRWPAPVPGAGEYRAREEGELEIRDQLLNDRPPRDVPTELDLTGRTPVRGNVLQVLVLGVLAGLVTVLGLVLGLGLGLGLALALAHSRFLAPGGVGPPPRSMAMTQQVIFEQTG